MKSEHLAHGLTVKPLPRHCKVFLHSQKLGDRFLEESPNDHRVDWFLLQLIFVEKYHRTKEFQQCFGNGNSIQWGNSTDCNTIIWRDQWAIPSYPKSTYTVVALKIRPSSHRQARRQVRQTKHSLDLVDSSPVTEIVGVINRKVIGSKSKYHRLLFLANHCPLVTAQSEKTENSQNRNFWVWRGMAASKSGW